MASRARRWIRCSRRSGGDAASTASAACLYAIKDLPTTILNRLQHYFLTYKQLPGEAPKCEIAAVYGREEALEVIRRSQKDYNKSYGNLEEALSLTMLEAFQFAQRQQDLLKNI